MNTQSIIKDWCLERTANTHSVWPGGTDTRALVCVCVCVCVWNISCESKIWMQTTNLD